MKQFRIHKKALMVLAVFGMFFHCHAQTADEVLKKCQYLESQPSYTATVENLTRSTDMGDGIKLVMVQKCWGKQNDDGTKQSRVEITANIQGNLASLHGRKPPLIPTTIAITTVTGEIWKLDPTNKEAVQLSFVKNALKTATTSQTSTEQSDLVGAKNELSEESLDDQPCFKITQLFSQEAIEKQVEMWQSPQFASVKQNAAQRIIAKKELWVRKSDYLVIQTCIYDTDGNRISGTKYTDIAIGVPLAADLFEIPKDYKKTTIDSPKEFAAKTVSTAINPNIGFVAAGLQSTSHKSTITVLLVIFLVLIVISGCALIWSIKTKT